MIGGAHFIVQGRAVPCTINVLSIKTAIGNSQLYYSFRVEWKRVQSPPRGYQSQYSAYIFITTPPEGVIETGKIA